MALRPPQSERKGLWTTAQVTVTVQFLRPTRVNEAPPHTPSARQEPPRTPTRTEGWVNERVTGKLYVRTEPAVSSPVLIELAPGNVLIVLEELEGESYSDDRKDWCRIDYSGQQGFVPAYYIDIQRQPKWLTRWDRALAQVSNTGASASTTRQHLLPEEVQSSHRMAEADLQQVKAIAGRFCTAAAKFGVPAAVLAALASRESRCGKALSSDGWGDNHHAFGIMQIDKRFHELAGEPDPTSLAHIQQAAAIFFKGLEALHKRHPDWEDPDILKGAAAAYNAGVKAVARTRKERTDTAITGKDYGADVMARAQYYARHAELSVFRIEG